MWGGKRKGAGRPRSDDPPKKGSIMLRESEWKRLDAYGFGQLSKAGVLRWLLDNTRAEAAQQALRDASRALEAVIGPVEAMMATYDWRDGGCYMKTDDKTRRFRWTREEGLTCV
jgi:hypothetical protein